LENIQLKQRFLYAEIIEKAINLVIEKYGEEDDFGVSLGIRDPEDIYEYLECFAVVKAAKSTKKAKSDAPKVKRAPSPYIIFCNENRDKIKSANPTATFGQLGKLCSEAWAKLNEAGKKPYVDKSEKKKKELGL
jgi:hypothetical protein